MIATHCEREADLLDAIQSARWPDRVDADLRTHVAACAICSDTAIVAPAIAGAALDDPDEGQVPEAGAVWLRAQWQARADASRVAIRPIAATQAVALACVTGLVGALVGASSAWLQGQVSRVAVLAWRAVPGPDLWSALGASIGGHVWLAGVSTLCLLAAPAVVYVATRSE